MLSTVTAFSLYYENCFCPCYAPHSSGMERAKEFPTCVYHFGMAKRRMNVAKWQLRRH